MLYRTLKIRCTPQSARTVTADTFEAKIFRAFLQYTGWSADQHKPSKQIIRKAVATVDQARVIDSSYVVVARGSEQE